LKGLERNIKLVLEYDGADFCGWQVQPGMRTVQGTVQESLKVFLGEEVSLTAAARTDSGVHALGQVANFHTGSTMALPRMERALNSILPPDVAVRKLEEVPPEFNARFDARSKLYRYAISFRKRALGRAYSWHVRYNLDLGRMERAAGLLTGSHDFSSFCAADSSARTYVCSVKGISFEFEDEALLIYFEADRFLRHMVRIMVGTLVEAGRGAIQPGDVSDILRSRERSLAGPTAPPWGLCLMEVRYGP